MLVLTRGAGQCVLIGADIVVTVLSSKNGQVRLGFDAPSDLIILREELQIQRQMPLQFLFEKSEAQYFI